MASMHSSFVIDVRVTAFAVLVLVGCNAHARVEAPPPAVAIVQPEPLAAPTTQCTSATMSDERLRTLHVWMHDTLAAWPALTLQSRIEGEDATSAFEYFRLSDASGVRLLRVVWNGGAMQLPTVTDYHFREGRLVVVLERIVSSDAIESFRHGKDDGRATQRSLALFDDAGKMTSILDDLDRPSVVSCEDWNEREAGYASFVSMDWS
jgi:hypothetical protein